MKKYYRHYVSVSQPTPTPVPVSTRAFKVTKTFPLLTPEGTVEVQPGQVILIEGIKTVVVPEYEYKLVTAKKTIAEAAAVAGRL